MPTRWPVRDQGPRPTCVAFAMVACREFKENESDPPDLSEQFMFWASKKRDRLSKTGTTLSAAVEALLQDGVCDRDHWPYQFAPMVGQDPITHESANLPNQLAKANAKGLARRFTLVRRPRVAEVVRAIEEHGIVALTLKMFEDPNRETDENNWTNTQTTNTGIVVDPHHSFRELDYGHAICLVGYSNPSRSRGRGAFALRNSWGTQWGIAPQEFHGLKLPPGYGWISEDYVAKHSIEMVIPASKIA